MAGIIRKGIWGGWEEKGVGGRDYKSGALDDSSTIIELISSMIKSGTDFDYSYRLSKLCFQIKLDMDI